MMHPTTNTTNKSTCSPLKELSSPPPAAAVAEEDVWEVRPGGMLVQKRNPDSDGAPSDPIPTIRVKVKYAGVYHEIYINSQSSFGELKKMLSTRTGLHPEDQKLVYKDKERDSKAFLDNTGVKDRSKMVLLEDPTAKAKRLLEQRRNDKAEKAAKNISGISLEVDRLASKVSALETIVDKGGKVVDGDVVMLTESLMNELIKLDMITAEGEVKVQKQMQEKRVKKYVETLDAIKIKNAAAATTAAPRANGQANGQLPPRPPKPQYQQQKRQCHPAAATTVTAPTQTTNWESFDLLSSTPSTSSTPTTIMSPSTASSTGHTTTVAGIPKFEWELF